LPATIRRGRIAAEREQVVEAPQAVEAGFVPDRPYRTVRRDRVDLRCELQADAQRMGHGQPSITQSA
jgi:hypothetical protein